MAVSASVRRAGGGEQAWEPEFGNTDLVDCPRGFPAEYL